MKDESATITARVPAELKKAFEDAAGRNDRTTSQLLRDFMRQYVQDHAQGDLLKGRKR